MPLSPARHIASKVLFALGSVWGVAGAFKLLFGVKLTVPFLPPLGLEQVAAVPAIIVAVGCFTLAAWLGRSPDAHATRTGAMASGHDERLLREPWPNEEAQHRSTEAVPRGFTKID